MAGVLQHLRSSTLNKRPNPASMVDGQIAINYASGSPGAFFKDTNGNLVKVGPVHVGATAPNVSPASGGTAGNSLGGQWLDTSGGTYVFKIWDGAAWRSEAGEFVNSTGDTMTGSLTMGPSANLIFEGSTDDGFETTLTVVDPTADRTITLPNVSGTVVTTGDSGTVTSTMIADGTIVNADVNASAAIAGTKISPDFGSQTIQTTGVFSHAVGSAGAPTITFTGDTNTGIYSPGADQVAISTGGSGRLFVDASGNVGVGASSPTRALDVNGSIQLPSNNALYINGSNNYLYADSTATELASATLIKFVANGSERLRITSAGLVGIGTSSPESALDVRNASLSQIIAGLNGGQKAVIGSDTSTGAYVGTLDNYDIKLITNSTVRAIVTSAGLVGVGTSSPNGLLDVRSATAWIGDGTTDAFLQFNQSATAANRWHIGTGTSNALIFYKGTYGSGSETARIDSSGRLLIGTSSARSNFYNSSSYSPRLQLESANDGASSSIALISVSGGGFDEPNLVFAKSRGSAIGNNTIVVDGDDIGNISFQASDGSEFVVAANILAEVDGTPGANDMPGRLVFSTTADGASSPTERMRIDSAGRVLIGTTDTLLFSNVTTGEGCVLEPSGGLQLARSGDSCLYINRLASDGELVRFYQDGNQEGTISVSGSTVSYNGAHLSRWSQLPGGATRKEILRGTVLSNIDEMCEWGEEDNEQLNRMKVSDVEGDKNVAGVFQAWDDDDDTYTNDFYCAMTGDFIIRIGAGVTVERGDLLISAGDGTAKPQDDDIIRSKTIAKVTSTNVSCTYEDGSYCVPCVLMAC